MGWERLRLLHFKFTMIITLILLVLALAGAGVFLFTLKNQAERALEEETRAMREKYVHDSKRVEEAYAQKVAELEREADKIRQHYEKESREQREVLEAQVEENEIALARLSKYSQIAEGERVAEEKVREACELAERMLTEISKMEEVLRVHGEEQKLMAEEKARGIYQQAEALMIHASSEAARIVAEAEQKALLEAGETYEAMRDKKVLDRAVRAVKNVIEGYGDRYVVPTHSLIDNLAEEFGHLAAGEALRIARENTRSLVLNGNAAACDYVEKERKETAMRFVIDAFNGRVDAILSRVRHDNAGTLDQEIIDAFALVNLNGEAFRSARILSPYLEARRAELKWAGVVLELKRKEREEQRRIQEQIREEERARREYEKAQQEAAREEEILRKAMVKVQEKIMEATAGERLKMAEELEEIKRKLAEAEDKNRRAISMAQQTRAGNVYIISNVGAFGEDVLKIGMTRRLEPLDRVRELGDASVPFEFDVHAMIRSDDAPGLEKELHETFDDHRVNKVNYRKEFFRVPLAAIREFVTRRGLEAAFTMAAEAREYRESVALEKMTPEERAKYHLSEEPIDSED